MIPSAGFWPSDTAADRVQVAAHYAFASAWKPDTPIRRRQAYLLAMRRRRDSPAPASSQRNAANPEHFLDDLVTLAQAEQKSRQVKGRC
jgi:hypothetical protein